MTKLFNNSFKILMSADTLGGVWTYAMELIHGLERCDVQVVLATMGRPVNDYQMEQIKQLKNVKLEESVFKLEWMEDPWEDIENAGDWLLELEEKHAPDIIHLNNYVHAVLPFRAPVIVVAHSDVCSWWRAVKDDYVPEKYKVYMHKVREGLKKADCVVTPTSAMLSCINHHYGCMSNEQVIANARDPKKFFPQKKKPYILSIGRLWDEAKNIRLLEKVADSLAWPVFVAGDINHPDKISDNQFNQLHFLGRLTEQEVSQWLSSASIYVMPARYEPFGLSVLEAALSKCALILGDIKSLRENWDKAALFVNPDRPDELTKKITMLQKDKSFREVLATAAYERATNFSPVKMTAEYLRVYNELSEKSIENINPYSGQLL